MNPPFELERGHRWFAIECNNQAWELIERDGGPGDEADRLIHLAHASVYHWAEVGTELNRLRGLSLLAASYLAAGRGEQALRYAKESLALAEQDSVEATPFDQATATLYAAQALASVGEADKAQSQQAAATELAAGLEHPEERKVFAAMLARAGLGDGKRIG